MIKMNPRVIPQWAVGSIMALALCLAAACGKQTSPEERASPSSSLPPGEWFWFDRLSERPEPLHRESPPREMTGKVAELIDQVREKTPVEADRIAPNLSQLGAPVIPLLLPYLEDEDPAVRWAAIIALGRLEDPGSLGPLLSVLRDPWDAAAIMAISYVSRFPEPWIVPRLIKAVGPYPVDYNLHLLVRIKASGILIRMGNYSTVPFLIKALEDDTSTAYTEREWDQTSRMSWAKEEALAILEELTSDNFGFHIDASWQGQVDAAGCFKAWWIANQERLWRSAPALDDPMLAKVIRQIVQGLASFQARNADGARYCLKMLGPPVFPYLQEALSAGGFYERFHALDIVADLAPIAYDRATVWSEIVSKILNDKSPAVRMKAARTLGFLGQPAAVSALKAALNDSDLDVRLCAVEALGRIGSDAARDRLLELLSPAASIIDQIRVEAAAALVRIASDYDPAFLDELRSEDAKRRDYAHQKLIELLGDDFGYDLNAPKSDRKAAAQKIEAALKNTPRPLK